MWVVGHVTDSHTRDVGIGQAADIHTVGLRIGLRNWQTHGSYDYWVRQLTHTRWFFEFGLTGARGMWEFDSVTGRPEWHVRRGLDTFQRKDIRIHPAITVKYPGIRLCFRSVFYIIPLRIAYVSPTPNLRKLLDVQQRIRPQILVTQSLTSAYKLLDMMSGLCTMLCSSQTSLVMTGLFTSEWY